MGLPNIALQQTSAVLIVAGLASDLKSKTKATLVELLVRQAYEATAISPAVDKKL
jgi:hypothetical protein